MNITLHGIHFFCFFLMATTEVILPDTKSPVVKLSPITTQYMGNSNFPDVLFKGGVALDFEISGILRDYDVILSQITFWLSLQVKD